MTFAPLVKWSVGDYHRMIETGILADRPVELLAGDIVEMSPETPLHYSTGKQGAHYLTEMLRGKADVRFNGPITLVDSEPEPDIAIARLPESLYRDRHPGPADLFWVIEIAHSSFQKDSTLKAQLYAIAAIPEYWLVDIGGQQLWIFRHPKNGQYQQVTTQKDGWINPIAFPDLSIAVEPFLL